MNAYEARAINTRVVDSSTGDSRAGSIRAVNEQIENLPSIGEIEQGIIRLLETDADYGKITQLVLQDPLLATRLLGLANSPFYGVRGAVTSVSMACAILGVKTLHSYIISLAFFGSLHSPLSKLIIAHSFQVAILNQFLAEKTGLRDDSVFIVGLLHDIGKIYIAEYYPTVARDLFSVEYMDEQELVRQEIDRVGFHHVQIGVLIARHWELPDKIVDVINNQLTVTHEMSELNKLLMFSDFIADDIKNHDSEKALVKRIPKTVWDHIDIDKKQIKQWYADLIKVNDQAAKLTKLLV